MPKANSIDTTTLPGDEPGSQFAALAVAMPRSWHRDVIRLTQASERVEELLKALPATAEWSSYRGKLRALASSIIDLLDSLDPDPDLEPSLATFSIHRETEADECEISEDDEPSLGGLDRRMDQTRWHAGGRGDHELDNSDDEPSLGSLDHRDSQELWTVGDRRDLERDDAESGIGDQDGLDEQVPFRDWQNVGMV